MLMNLTFFTLVILISSITIIMKDATFIGKYWNGEFTDIPAMGYDFNLNTGGYCEIGDHINFKIYKKLCASK